MFGLTLPGNVLDVHDGDTVTVEVKRTLRIRLLDCWAPELRDAGGLEAIACRIARAVMRLKWRLDSEANSGERASLIQASWTSVVGFSGTRRPWRPTIEARRRSSS